MTTRQRQHLSICVPEPKSKDAGDRDDSGVSATTAIGVIVVAFTSGAGFLLGLSLLRQFFD